MIFVVVTLIGVIIAMAVERFFYGQQMSDQHEKMVTALLSRDATEYSIAVKTEKDPVKPQVESDEVDLGQASDEEFDKFIKK